ncbi:MAG: hypothetical protein ACO1PB_20265 [Ramlibacter sp.]
MKATGVLLAVAACTAHAQEVRPTRPGDVHVTVTEARADRKTYEETVTVTAVEGDRIRTRHVRSDNPAPAEGVYGLDWSTFKSGSSGSSFEPPARTVVRPLEVGKAWNDAYLVTTSTGARSQLKIDYKVTGREKLATPAGEFDAYRIEGKGYINGVSWPGGFGVVQSIWYAPAIDRVVRFEHREQRTMGAENVTVLKQFKPAE